MAAFNRSLSRKRAIKRWLSGAQKAGSSVDRLAALVQFNEDIAAIEGIATTVEWCDSKGVSTTFLSYEPGEFGGFSFIDKKQTLPKVEISCRLPLPKQLHVLLHECGHYLMWSNHRAGSDERFSKRVRFIFVDDEVPWSKRSFEHKCLIVEEELEAWRRGWRLAEKLEIELDEAAFNRTKALNVKTYMKWAVGTRQARNDGVKTKTEAKIAPKSSCGETGSGAEHVVLDVRDRARDRTDDVRQDDCRDASVAITGRSEKTETQVSQALASCTSNPGCV